MLTLEVKQEIIDTLDQINKVLEDLIMRGLRTANSEDLKQLGNVIDEFKRIGAGHISERLERVLQDIQADSPCMSQSILQAQISLRLFERILTLEVAANSLDESLQEVESE